MLPILVWGHGDTLAKTTVLTADTTLIRLQQNLTRATQNSAKVQVLKNLCWYYRYINLDSCKHYGELCIDLAKQNNYKKIEADVTRFIGISYWHYAYEEECLEWIYASLAITEAIHDVSGEGYCYDNIGNCYFSQGLYDKAFENFSKGAALFTQNNDTKGLSYTLLHSSWILVERKQFDSAAEYIQKAIVLRRALGDSLLVKVALREMGNLFRGMGKYNEALTIYRQTLAAFQQAHLHYSLADDYYQMAETFRQAGKHDSAQVYALRSLEVTKAYNNYRQILKSAKTLQLSYMAVGNYERALYYQNLYYQNKERLINDKIALQLSRKKLQHDFDVKEDHLRNRNLMWLIILGSCLIVALAIVAVVALNQRKTHKYNLLLQAKNNEILLQKQALENQAAELSRLNEVKDKMFSVVSHDIRSPLTSLQAMLYLYHDALVTPDEIKKLMPEISTHVTNTTNFVDNLLYWAKSQLNGLSLQQTMFDINGTIANELTLLQQKMQEKHIMFHFEPTQPAMVFADKDMIAVVLRNLLNNAIKFTPAYKRVFITVQEAATETITCISDEGKGMSKEQLNKLFVTSHTTVGTANETGSGLGLLLSYDFVQQNKGRIWAETELGLGSSFFLALPKQQLR
jgi:signal transduction histidine kinase